MMLRSLLSIAALAGSVMSYGEVLGFNSKIERETRSLDEICKAALKEGDTVTLWHGGDATNQQDRLKQAFENRFPGITLNLTVDPSKYHNVRLDEQLAAGGKTVYVDSIILQTLHDYSRWAQEGALLNYAPKGFDKIDHAFKDSDAYWYGVYVLFWSNAWNTEKLPGIKEPVEYDDWLRPEFKNKLVLTYPNDDDAVLFAFYLILQENGLSWFDALLEQNPRWVRGIANTEAIARNRNSTQAAYFAAAGGFGTSKPMNFSKPKKGKYVSWAQYAAILKDSPHPEGAKLLHNFILSPEYQSNSGTWPVRRDIPAPEGFPDLWNETATNPAEFARFMEDRALVERMRFWFEARIGVPEGGDPVNDPIDTA